MQKLSKKILERHEDIKKNITQSYEYFKENYQRFNDFTEFVCKTSITDEDKEALEAQEKPLIEFNILEAFVSRQRGEFAKQQPSLKVRAADGVPDELLTPNFIKQIEIVEQHLRAIFFDSNDDMLEYDCWSDMLIGGFTVARLYTEYVNEMSFEQNIKIERVFNPTLTGFDPLARKSHKGDGRFCWERYPVSKDEFKLRYGEEALEKIKFDGSPEGGLGWSYKNMQEEIIMLTDYYEKKLRKTEIVRLTNGHNIEVKNYEKFKAKWKEKFPDYPVPKMIEKMKRTTYITDIVRYRLSEADILEYQITNFTIFPLIFGAGNAVTLTRDSMSYQMTRPYVYHAIGMQKLKNYAGQSLGNELENTMNQKLIMPIESVPEEYLDDILNNQLPSVILYHHYLDTNNPEATLPSPREVQRTPIPPEISRTFAMADEMVQAILGSYDAALGINSNQLSGSAIDRGAMQSNTAAMPFHMGYLKMINQLSRGIVDLIPKYYVTPRSLPILKPDGSRDVQIINRRNAQDSIFMHFDPNMLSVKVAAGVNFAIQKDLTLRMIKEWSSSNETFARFINEKCLINILDNMDIRGIEDMKLKAREFEQELAQEKAQAGQVQSEVMQMQKDGMKMQQQSQAIDLALKQKQLQQPTKEQIELEKLDAKTSQEDAKLAMERQKMDMEFLKIMNDIRMGDMNVQMKEAQIDAENARTMVQVEFDRNKHQHQVMMDVLDAAKLGKAQSELQNSSMGQESENEQEE